MTWRRILLVWLYIGLFMVFVQILVGGITRLTGSGLSITKWDIVTGTLPPLSDVAWQEEFDLYKATPQYAKINDQMPLGDSIFDSGSFKFIYFWEYIHRLWARTMGFVFLFPFLFFVYKRVIPKLLIRDLMWVVGFAALAAIFGWIMVASGLINRPWVNAYKLAIHLSIGFAVFLAQVRATYLFCINYDDTKRYNRWTTILLIISSIQIFFGGIMSGTKAALFYPTWPDMRGDFVPSAMLDSSLWTAANFVEYDKTLLVVAIIQFLHRMTAYLLVVLFAYYAYRRRPWTHDGDHQTSFYWSSCLIGLQVVLGITVLLTSLGSISVLWGVLHQGVAALFMAALLVHHYAPTERRV